MKCFLDMDGVLADFVKGAERLHNLPSIYANPAMLGIWNFVEHLPMEEEEFWSKCTPDFWENLEPTAECFKLVETAERLFGAKNVAILSSPGEMYDCMAPKARWIRRHLPNYKRRFLLGYAKDVCAHERAVLVDDSGDNIDLFTHPDPAVQPCPGVGILMPRLWNKRHDQANQSLAVVARELEIARLNLGI